MIIANEYFLIAQYAIQFALPYKIDHNMTMKKLRDDFEVTEEKIKDLKTLITKKEDLIDIFNVCLNHMNKSKLRKSKEALNVDNGVFKFIKKCASYFASIQQLQIEDFMKDVKTNKSSSNDLIAIDTARIEMKKRLQKIKQAIDACFIETGNVYIFEELRKLLHGMLTDRCDVGIELIKSQLRTLNNLYEKDY